MNASEIMKKRNNEIYHWGIRGMKWGVRRYQNKDGSLTKLGQKRYDQDLLDNPLTKKERRDGGRKVNANKWVKDDISNAKKVADFGSDFSNKANNLMNSVPKKQNKRMDLSKMSDKEMRDKINRELLERQYNSVFNEPKVSKGRQYASTALSVGGSVLAATGSALGIALAIKELKG